MDQKKKLIPELNYLLTQVEKHYGRRVATATDFEALSVFIEHETGELLSASTLKRLWGYVSSRPSPRKDTLDILCRFIGILPAWDWPTGQLCVAGCHQESSSEEPDCRTGRYRKVVRGSSFPLQ